MNKSFISVKSIFFLKPYILALFPVICEEIRTCAKTNKHEIDFLLNSENLSTEVIRRVMTNGIIFLENQVILAAENVFQSQYESCSLNHKISFPKNLRS